MAAPLTASRNHEQSREPVNQTTRSDTPSMQPRAHRGRGRLVHAHGDHQQPADRTRSPRSSSTASRRRSGSASRFPHYCWHPALSVVASCRMCLVEVGDKKPDGTIVMQPKLVPGCQTPAKDGTVVVTDSAKVKAAQQAMLEDLLLNHPLDCPICDQAGECCLQDYSFKYGRGYSRLQEPKNIKPDKDHIGEHDHAVHRPLHHVHPLRPVHPRDQRHARAAGRSTAARTKRSTSSPATRATTSSRATSSTSARSAPCAARTSSTSSASGG